MKDITRALWSIYHGAYRDAEIARDIDIAGASLSFADYLANGGVLWIDTDYLALEEALRSDGTNIALAPVTLSTGAIVVVAEDLPGGAQEVVVTNRPGWDMTGAEWEEYCAIVRSRARGESEWAKK